MATLISLLLSDLDKISNNHTRYDFELILKRNGRIPVLPEMALKWIYLLVNLSVK